MQPHLLKYSLNHTCVRQLENENIYFHVYGTALRLLQLHHDEGTMDLVHLSRLGSTIHGLNSRPNRTFQVWKSKVCITTIKKKNPSKVAGGFPTDPLGPVIFAALSWSRDRPSPGQRPRPHPQSRSERGRVSAGPG